MSLTMMALRICAVEALRQANTLVGTNVLDSKISAFDQTADGQMTSDQKRPFIAVYTDGSTNVTDGRVGLRGVGSVDVVFNTGVSVAMAVTDPTTGESVIEGYPATDENLEAVIDVLETQICRALVDPQSAWAQAFGAFVQEYGAKSTVRSSSSAERVRLAAGQMKISIDVWPDPALGQGHGDTGHWGQFMTLMRAGSHPRLGLFEAALGDGDLGPREFEHLVGMTRHTKASLGLPDVDAAPMSDVSLDFGDG